ncbi:MAG: heme ABC transporter permease [Alphaproteobacteria bacterium]
MLTVLANPLRFDRFARSAMPWIALFTGVTLATGLIWGLVYAPEDYQQGHSVRIMYVHVPAAWMALFTYTFIAGASAVAFIWRHTLADVSARAAAPVGAAFTLLALATGSLWGKPMWGAWWVWDARLTSVLVLFFIYVGYMMIWAQVSDQARAARLARVTALVGFVNIPIIKFSVDWWNSLHQPASVVRLDGPTIHPDMLWPLLIMAIAYTSLFAWLVMAGMRAEILERRRGGAEDDRPAPATIRPMERDATA